MKILIDINTLSKYSRNDKIPFKCEHCHNTFYAPKSRAMVALKGAGKTKLDFCSRACSWDSSVTEKEYPCKNCEKPVKKRDSDVRKVANVFCSQSCAALYNNRHRKSGGATSKAEGILEEIIKNDFHNIEIIRNTRKILPSKNEIDLYIPSCNLAIEINGITHYSPIFGLSKFLGTQSRDKAKKKELENIGINFIVIDISNLKREKETTEFLQSFYNSNIFNIIRACR